MAVPKRTSKNVRENVVEVLTNDEEAVTAYYGKTEKSSNTGNA